MSTAYIFGTGSIACRHSRVLHHCGVKAIAVSRSQRDRNAIELPNNFSNVIGYDDITPARRDFAVIAVPTGLHTETCRIAEAAGFEKIFCEKPGPDIESEKIRVLYNLRYLPFIQMAHAQQHRIRALKLQFHTDARLWHPWEDWRESYVFRADLGGGCVKTNAHELDMISFLGIDPSACSLSRKYDYLDIDGNRVDTGFIFGSKDSSVCVTSSITTKSPRRRYRLETDSGVLSYEFQPVRLRTATQQSDVDLTYFAMWLDLLNGRYIVPHAADTRWILHL